MAEMEDKFQEILGNEQAMSQIMSLAQSFGGGQAPSTEVGTDSMDVLGSLEGLGGLDGLDGLMNSLDPKMMAMAMRLMTAYQSGHRTIDLMTALRPFVSEERHSLMDRLATATKLARVASSVVDIFLEKEVDHV